MTTPIPELSFSDALIVVDVQNDFAPAARCRWHEG